MPDGTDKQFRLGQEKRYESLYAAARSSRSTVFLFWYRETDVVYAVGLDERQRVTYAASGGT